MGKKKLNWGSLMKDIVLAVLFGAIISFVFTMLTGGLSGVGTFGAVLIAVLSFGIAAWVWSKGYMPDFQEFVVSFFGISALGTIIALIFPGYTTMLLSWFDVTGTAAMLTVLYLSLGRAARKSIGW